MAIRIRVYPQPNSVGARRNRAVRRQQQQINQQRQQLIFQQQLMRQQQLIQQQQRAYGYSGGFAGAYNGASEGGYLGNGIPTPLVPLPPNASSWGFVGQQYGAGYSPIGGAWAGAYATPTYAGAYSFGPTVGQYGVSQYGVSQYGASQYGASQYGAYGC